MTCSMCCFDCAAYHCSPLLTVLLHACPSMHVRHLIFCLTILSAVFYSSLMSSRFRCGAPLCRQAFDSSGSLLCHQPSCLFYQQQAATQANFRCKCLQSNTGHHSVPSKKPKLLQETVRKSVMIILTLAYLKFNRTSIRQNLIRPAPSQACCCDHHTPPHLNALTMPSYQMLALVRL